MGQIAYRANLSAATFPMTIADGGRTVIIPGPDQNFDRRVDPEGEQKDAGIPQALYMENVIPTPNGYQSVGYVAPTLDIDIAGSNLSTVMSVPAYDASDKTISLIPLYISDTGVFKCGNLGNLAVTITGGTITYGQLYSTAVVGPKCYFYSDFDRSLFEVTQSSGSLTFTKVSETPANFFTTNEVVCIIGSSNYLIALTKSKVYYSSLTTPSDFVSSLVSGAGSIAPNELTEDIVYGQACSDGFYIFTFNSALYCQYTGNARYPWKFTSVKGSSGIYANFNCYKYVISHPSNAAIFVLESNNQIKIYSRNEASSLSADLSDFLSKSLTYRDIFDYSTNIFTVQSVGQASPALFLYDNRYLIVSYSGAASGADTYSHAIVYDIVLRKAGKLKRAHSFVFSAITSVASLGTDLYLVSDAEKKCYYMYTDLYRTTGTYILPHQGALLLGKFQYVRSRMMKMEEIEIEGPQNTSLVSSPNFSAVLIPSQDGRNFDAPIPLTPASVIGGLATYDCHNTARNHSLLIKGAFSVNTVQLKFVPAGDR